MVYGFDREMLAERIKSLRAKRNVTTRELGKAIGVASTTISKWEKSQTIPSAENIYNLAKFFNVSPGYLVGVE